MGTLARELAAFGAAIRESDDDDHRGVFADWLRERGHEAAADALLARHCQRCLVPDRPGLFVLGRDGRWYSDDDAAGMNSDAGVALFGEEFVFLIDGVPGVCGPYETGGVVFPVVWCCATCRHHFVAAKAYATLLARKAAGPDLFSSVGEAPDGG